MYCLRSFSPPRCPAAPWLSQWAQRKSHDKDGNLSQHRDRRRIFLITDSCSTSFFLTGQLACNSQMEMLDCETISTMAQKGGVSSQGSAETLQKSCFSFLLEWCFCLTCHVKEKKTTTTKLNRARGVVRYQGPQWHHKELSSRAHSRLKRRRVVVHWQTEDVKGWFSSLLHKRTPKNQSLILKKKIWST